MSRPNTRTNTGGSAPTVDVPTLIALAKEAKLNKLVKKCERDASFAAQAVKVINGVLAQAHAKKMAREAAAVGSSAPAPAPSDATGPGAVWLALADVVDATLPELSVEEREALKAAFRAEAKAVGKRG